MGQLGTSPSATSPTRTTPGTSAHSCRRAARVRADARGARQHKTDGHMDVDAVRAGAILICPVKLAGGGVYLGDMHALQGDGEIAGHTCDVAGTVTLQVEVLKGLGIDGPVLFPLADGPAVPGQAARERGAQPGARAGRPAGASPTSRSRCRSRSSGRARTSTAPPTTASRARPSCSADRAGGQEPGHHHGRDRDRAPPRRRAGDLPRADRRLERCGLPATP